MGLIAIIMSLIHSTEGGRSRDGSNPLDNDGRGVHRCVALEPPIPILHGRDKLMAMAMLICYLAMDKASYDTAANANISSG